MSFFCSRKYALLAILSIVLGISARDAFAMDRDLAYLHSLQSRGFGDVAVSYLESLSKSNSLPQDVREVFDLEMSKSLRSEAQNTLDPAQRGLLLARSQKCLNQFVANNPNHPEALQAQVASAEMMFDQAQTTIADSRRIRDETEKTNALLQARAELVQVKSVLQPSVVNLIARIRSLGPPPTRRVRGQLIPKDRESMTQRERAQEAQRQDLEFDLIRTSGELALIDYFTAQTYGRFGDDAAARKQALNASAKLLDAYYQQHRSDSPVSELGRSGFIGALVAHTWYGKAVEELNDRIQAQDVFDEVLENFPDPPNPKKPKEDRTGLESILSRAKFYSLQLLERNPKRQKEFMQQAEDFVNNYKSLFRGEWGYEAASLEVAKHLLAAAETETDAKKKSAESRSAIAILKDITAVPSEFQADAAQMLQKVSIGVRPNTVDEALGFIRIALDQKKWTQAEELCRWAMDALNKQTKKDANYTELMGKLQDTLVQCQIQPIFDDFSKHREPFDAEKYQAWLEAGENTARENKKSVIAPKAAAFASYCAAVLYGKARNDVQQARTPSTAKAASAEAQRAFKQLTDTTNFIFDNFPNSPEADEARLSLGKAKWADGNVADAIATFESIDPKSEKYPEALRLAGELHVEQFQSELRKPQQHQDKALIQKYRNEAIASLTRSVNEQMLLLRPGDAIPADLVNTQLLLAQVDMEGKEYAAAVKVLQPLIDAAYAAKSKTALDDSMLKIFSTAVLAYMHMDDFKKAGAAGNVLIDLGPDKREVNSVLVDFVRRLDIELKSFRDQLDKLADLSPTETESLRGRIASIKQMLSTMVTKLSERKELDPKCMVYLGSLFTDVDDFDSAKAQYRKISNLPQVDEKLKLWVESQLVDILGKEGELDKATEEIAKLRQQRPNNLDFMKVEAQLWQEWGQKDPTRYDTAAQKWSEIRRRLQRQKSQQGTIYYDAVYNASFCLFMEANKLALNPTKHGDAIQKADYAEKILNSELIPNPKLDGPQSVKRFNDMHADVEKLIKRLRQNSDA